MNRIPSGLKKENLEVITIMNEVYFGESGRPGNAGKWSNTQVRIATNYFSKLLEGSYIDLSSQLERKIKADAPQELIINQALNAFTDFTKSGWDFLYNTDPNISSDTIRTIALKLIKKIKGANFTNRQCAETAITVLIGIMNENVLHSARNTWLEDHYSPPHVPYDADITNRALIPEAIQYAEKNIPSIK